MEPEQWAKEQMVELGMSAFFTGTVVLPDGAVTISTPIPEELARQIAVLSVEYDLMHNKRAREQNEKREDAYLRELARSSGLAGAGGVSGAGSALGLNKLAGPPAGAGAGLLGSGIPTPYEQRLLEDALKPRKGWR